MTLPPRYVLLAWTLAVLLIGGCGADSASEPGDESIATATTAVTEPTTASEESEGVDDVGEPPSGFVRLTFNFESSFTDAMPELSTFEVFSTSDDTPILLGSLDQTGTIDVSTEALPERLRLQAEFVGDPYCWWSGVVGVFDLQTVQQLDVELDQVCA